MAARAGTLGSSPLFRGTTGPSQILKTPRGFQAMQEILKSEAAYFATPVGVAYLVDKYAIPEGTIKEMVSQVLGSLEPVIADTDLSGVVVQSKKDDDEVIDVKDEDLEVMPKQDVSTGGEPPDPDYERLLKELANLTIDELLRRVEDKAYHNLHDLYREEIEKRKETTQSFLAKDKNTIQYIEALNPNKIFGEVDLRTIDYSNKDAPVIDYEFNQETVDTVGAKSIASLDSQVNVDLQDVINRHGFKMPDVNLLNDALKGDADERYWWQKSSQWLDNFLEGHTKEDKDMFLNILSVTSGGVDPKQNLRLAMGIFSDYLLGQPTRMGLKMQDTLNQFFLNPDKTISTPKFGNYSDSFKYFAGITERAPNTVNDMQIARIFGVDPQVLAAQPELYALMTKALVDLTAEVNKTLPEGQELQPFELQSALWSKFRGGATNFAQVGPELITQLQEEGFIFKDGKLNMTELMQPSFVEKLQKTVLPYQEAYKATIEVGSFNTEAGKKIKQLLDYFPEDKKLHNDINKINQSIIRKFILKQDKKPSLIENLISLVKGEKTDVSRMQVGFGTYEGVASSNMIIPLLDLEEKERVQIISLLGKYLNQDTVAASNFKTFTGEIPEGHKNGMTGQVFVKSRIDRDKLQQLHKETGLDFNIRPVAGGFIAQILSFEGLPDEDKLRENVQKIFGKDTEMLYTESTWGSNFIGTSNYEEHIDELEKSISGRVEKEGAPKFNLDTLFRIIQAIERLDTERDDRFQKEIIDSKKIINLLTKKNITLKRRGGMIEIPHFHYGGFVDVNRL